MIMVGGRRRRSGVSRLACYTRARVRWPCAPRLERACSASPRRSGAAADGAVARCRGRDPLRPPALAARPGPVSPRVAVGLSADRDRPARTGPARGPRAARLPRGVGLALGASPAAARRPTGCSSRRLSAAWRSSSRCCEREPQGALRALMARAVSPSISSYHTVAVSEDARDPLAFLRAHARLLPQLTQGRKHAATHPPGPVLWYRGALALCERSPVLTEALLARRRRRTARLAEHAGARRPCRRAARRARPGLARRADALAARGARRGAGAQRLCRRPGSPRSGRCCRGRR